MIKEDKEFLQWIYDRMHFVHGENESYDYMHEFRSIIASIDIDNITQIAANKAAEEGGLPEGMVIAPHYRGYARLGIGAYVINHTADKPAELIISMATDDEKAGRVVGDNRCNPEGHMLQPELMAVRLCFENVAGLNALEDQLVMLRNVHFPESIAANRSSGQDEGMRNGLVVTFSAIEDDHEASQMVQSSEAYRMGYADGMAEGARLALCADKPSDTVPEGWPSEVWLQAGDDPLSSFSGYCEVSWCSAPQGESDVQYIRADLMERSNQEKGE